LQTILCVSCLCLYRGDKTRQIQIQRKQGAYSTPAATGSSGFSGYQDISELEMMEEDVEEWEVRSGFMPRPQRAYTLAGCCLLLGVA